VAGFVNADGNIRFAQPLGALKLVALAPMVPQI
jgi:hypothetical protein